MKPTPKYPLHLRAWRLFPYGVLLLACACSTTGKKDEVSMGNQTVAPAEKPDFASVDFTHEMSPVGDMLRLFGEQVPGGFVLMSGLEERAMPAVSFNREPYDKVIAHFADSLGCAYVHTPHYYMILPAGYEQLQAISLQEGLDRRYQDVSAGAAFGAKTELSVVFAVLSEILDLTIVADNFIAEARCGELHLPEAPLWVILEAILQSARIPADSVIVESTPEYIFLKAAQNQTPPSVQIASATPDPAVEALLEKEVSLSLPRIQENDTAAVFTLPMPLQEVLMPLTEQLGVEIVAKRQLADIPINPCVFNKVRLSTALTLFIRQWPVAEFGWEVQPGRILIREK